MRIPEDILARQRDYSPSSNFYLFYGNSLVLSFKPALLVVRRVMQIPGDHG